jgi:hypothetical protein
MTRGTFSARISRSGEGPKRRTGFAVAVLKVTSAFGAVVPYARPLRFPILEFGLALGTVALRLGITWPAYKLDVAHGAVAAEMASDGEVIDGADNG